MAREHYTGLIAEWYGDWLEDVTHDKDYYTKFFKSFEGQVLELACGTGRLLIPVAETGVTIHGLDSSQDILDVLQRKAAKLNIKGIKLHNQSMENFSIPIKYDAIFVASGSFQLLTSSESALKSLECVRDHLSDNGFFLVDIFIPWDSIVVQKRNDYHVTRDVVRPDGKRSIVLERFEIDIPNQIKRGTYRYEFYDKERLTDCITDDLSIHWYWKDEFLSLLNKVGFSRIKVLTQSSLYDEGYSYVFKASNGDSD